VVALVQGTPDPRATVAAMVAAGPDLRVRHAADGAILQLCEPSGPPLVSIEVPLFMQVPGEVERLLGAEVSRHVPVPVYWVEARAATEAADAGPIAGRFAEEMVRLLGGRVWREPGDGDPPALPSADPPGTDAADFPGVDLVTERAAVVVQSRPTVPLTAWLADALRRCGESQRALQLLTPSNTRLTLPLRLMLAAQNGRWVVGDGTADGHYDGLTGVPLTWDGAAFAIPRDTERPGGLADLFTRRPVPVGDQLICTLRTLHPAANDTKLGRAVELLCGTLTGAPPGGWGTAEPAAQPWNRDEVTARCRDRAPYPTWLVVVGGLGPRCAVGTMFVSRTPKGVEEAITLVVGERSGADPDGSLFDPDRLADVAERLVTEGAADSLYFQRTEGGPGVTAVPHWTGLPGPVGMALGTGSVREVGLTYAMSPPDVPARRIGDDSGSAVWYDLGDGTTPDSRARMERLTLHLSGGSAN
jgi:hypothetical protein